MPRPLSQNPSLYGTTTHRVLAIPEILELIFSYLDEEEHAKNARVCKNWSDVALDLLWRRVDDLPRLFRLLAPIQERHRQMYFERPLEPSDWTRFMRYASRVRTLVLDSFGDSCLQGPFVFDDVARTRATLNIFPKLSSLTWSTQTSDRMRLSFMFMHDSIKEFAVHLYQSSHYSLGTFFQEITLRMPRLTHLDLRFSFPVREIETHLCQLFESLPKLQEVTMPSFTLSSKIVETLSCLPNLRVVQFEFLEHQGCGDPADIADFNPHLEEDAFPSLHELNISAQIPHLLRFIKAPYFPCRIKVMYLHITHATAPAVLHDFLSTIVEICPFLSELHLDFLGDPSPIMYSNNPPEEDLVSWENLRPVLTCSDLNTFTFRWPTPLVISPKDIEEIASSWPSLETLILNNDALLTARPIPLTLDCLMPFARYCPELRELGLCVTATSAVPPAGLAPTPFRKLRKLLVGLSTIDDPEQAAIFLSQLCPPECEVLAGMGWVESFEKATVATVVDEAIFSRLAQDISTWCERWADVNRFLPLLTKLRKEERARRAELEREVEDLRIRYKILEERLDMGAGPILDKGCVLL